MAPRKANALAEKKSALTDDELKRAGDRMWTVMQEACDTGKVDPEFASNIVFGMPCSKKPPSGLVQVFRVDAVFAPTELIDKSESDATPLFGSQSHFYDVEDCKFVNILCDSKMRHAYTDADETLCDMLTTFCHGLQKFNEALADEATRAMFHTSSTYFNNHAIHCLFQLRQRSVVSLGNFTG